MVHQATQVGGHDGITTSEDGSLLIKPALPLELKFYEAINTNPDFEDLRPFVPKFYGSLALSEADTGAGITPQEGDKPKVTKGATESLVLENVTHSYLKPNILDIKLGTVLYGPDATPEKKARMEQRARETTSEETGVRLTGFQVHDSEQAEPVKVDKPYGRALKPHQLPEGMAKFFPVHSPPTSTKGLPPKLLLPILKATREDIQDIRDAYAPIEARMIGASLLIVYEGDIARAKECVEWMETPVTDDPEDKDEDEDDANEGDEASKNRKPGFPHTVKLIDFAHTTMTPGEGPDEGVLKGIDTVLRLLDGRIEEVRKESGAASESG